MATCEKTENEARGLAENRSETRTATMFRPVLIEAEQFAGFCLVRNLSPHGMMGHVYTDFAEETPVTLQFGPNLIVAGRIIWCRDGRTGVEFDEKIHVAEVLAEMGSEVFEGKINRAPRLEMRCAGELHIADRQLEFQLLDISQRGMKVRASFIQLGDEVEAQLDGLRRRKAVVRWMQNGIAGLNFISPIPFEELAYWVISRNADRLPDSRNDEIVIQAS